MLARIGRAIGLPVCPTEGFDAVLVFAFTGDLPSVVKVPPRAVLDPFAIKALGRFGSVRMVGLEKAVRIRRPPSADIFRA
jgi:hypothetical protein